MTQLGIIIIVQFV